MTQSEDMKILKKVFDIIDLSVPEELIKYLKVMTIKRSRRIMSWMEIMSWDTIEPRWSQRWQYFCT